MNTFTSAWRVIYTKPRHEKKVVEHLSRFDIDSFLPTTKILRKWHDRKKYLEMPLFPSYVFVYLKNSLGYYNSLSADGALYYIKTGKEIATVSNSIIDSIQLVNNEKEIEVSAEYLQPGQNLLITEGPFTGRSCEVVQYKGKQKILIRIDLLQRSVLVNLPIEYLTPYEKTLDN